MPRHLFIAVLLCLQGTVLAALLPDFSDNFDDGDDDGWVHYDPLRGLGIGGLGTWSFPDGNCRIQATGVAAGAGVGPARVGLYRTNNFSDFLITADFVDWDNSLNELFGLLARVAQPGLGTTAGYGLAYGTHAGESRPGRFEMYRIQGEVGATIASADYSLLPGYSYRFVFRGAADKLHAEILQLSNSIPLLPPVVVLNATDGAYSSGYSGVFGYDNSRAETNPVDFTIDNFSAAYLRPVLNITPAPDATTVVKWPRWASNYTLQSTDDLRNPIWLDVTWNLSFDDENYIFSDISDATLFFRLIAR